MKKDELALVKVVIDCFNDKKEEVETLKQQLNKKVSEDKTVELQNTINALRRQLTHYETTIDKINGNKSEAYNRLYDLRFELSTQDKMERYISDLKVLGGFDF